MLGFGQIVELAANTRTRMISKNVEPAANTSTPIDIKYVTQAANTGTEYVLIKVDAYLSRS